jgi:hypothetical protein
MRAMPSLDVLAFHIRGQNDEPFDRAADACCFQRRMPSGSGRDAAVSAPAEWHDVMGFLRNRNGCHDPDGGVDPAGLLAAVSALHLRATGHQGQVRQ